MREATHHTPTRLQFLPDWRTEQHGEITPGGKLVVEYDTARLPSIRPQQRATVACNVEAYIRFHPSDELRKESLVEEAAANSGGRITSHSLRPLEVVVPKDATQVELWFRTFDDVGGVREAWDSQFGQNYWFSVANRQAGVPQHEREAAPRQQQEAAPQHQHEAAPQHKHEAAPQHQHEATSQHQHEAAPQNKHEAAPQNKHEAAPQNKHEAAPQHQHEAASQHQHEAAPQNKHEAAPQHQHEAVPEQRQPSSDGRPAVQQSNNPASAKRNKRAR